MDKYREKYIPESINGAPVSHKSSVSWDTLAHSGELSASIEVFRTYR